MIERKYLITPVIYTGLAVFLVLNIFSMASIINGYMTWHAFFQDFLDVYRTLIRDPIVWVMELTVDWLGWGVPKWIADLFVIWNGLFLSANMMVLRMDGHTYVQRQIGRNGLLLGMIDTAIVFISMPVVMIVIYFFLIRKAMIGKSQPTDRIMRMAISITLVWFACIICPLLFLIFVNWQLYLFG